MIAEAKTKDFINYRINSVQRKEEYQKIKKEIEEYFVDKLIELYPEIKKENI